MITSTEPQKSFKASQKKRKFLATHLFQSFLFCIVTVVTSAQCLVTPLAPPCNPSGSSPTANNDVISTGQTRSEAGVTSINNLTVSGGTLIVCGTLTVNGLNFSSGVIYINPGASIMVNTGGSAIVFGNGCQIFNFGNFSINGSIVTGQNNLIFNCLAGSTFNVLFNQFVLQGPNTTLINNGIFTSSYFIVQPTNSPNPVCSGIGSVINTNIMINQFTNAFISPSGPSCIFIGQYIINSQPMTSSSNVFICYMASNVTVFGSPFFGSATVNSNCASCSIALPIGISQFTGVCDQSIVRLRWTAETEGSQDHFAIERSKNGYDFEEIANINSISNKGSNEYHYESIAEDQSIHYYKLKFVRTSRPTISVKTISVKCEIEDEFAIYPQFIDNNFLTVISKTGISFISVYDVSGCRILEMVCQNEKTQMVFLSDTLPKGIYIIKVKTVTGKFYIKKIVLT